MNAEIGLAMGSGLVSLGYYTYNCWGKRKRKNKLHKARLSALIMGKHTGKSTLKSNLDSHSSNLIIVDIGESVKPEPGTNEKLDYLAKANTYVKSLLDEFKTKKFLLLCESVEEATHVGVEKENIFLCVPSNALFSSLVKTLGNEDKDIRTEMEQSRMNLVRDCQKDQLNIFNTFDELKAVLKSAYKLENQF